jgi:hypothetical protein
MLEQRARKLASLGSLWASWRKTNEGACLFYLAAVLPTCRTSWTIPTIIRVPCSIPGCNCASLQPVGGLVTVQGAPTLCGARGFLFSSSCSPSLTFLAGSWCKEAFEEAQCPKPLDARQARRSFCEYKPKLLVHISQEVHVFGIVLSVLNGC